MSKKNNNYLRIFKLIIAIVIVFLFIWFLIISPKIKFHNNEKKMKEAAERYFEINSNELPTGKRVKTLTLSNLYSKKYLSGDFYVPYSNTLCDQTDSWVKVRKNNNGSYEYLVYLDCGILQSNVDHEGPEIKLNGEKEITISIGDKYTDPGVKSVVDNSDAELKISDVIKKGSIDTNKIGTYNIQYIAYDSLKNKTTMTRTIKVVKSLKSVVKKDLGQAKNYVGNPTNNYVRLSNMIYQIYGLDSNNNVILVAAEDVANVNFTKLNKWLNGYYYNHLNDKTKKMIVKAKYCNMTITDTTLDTTECTSYTNKVNIYVPSVIDINKAQGDGNFMKTSTMSWTANNTDNNKAYVTRYIFFGDYFGKNYYPDNVTNNYGVRPMFTIKGNSNIVEGDGTLSNPYTFGDSKKIKGGESIDKLSTGEYLVLSNVLYRVVDNENGLVKVIDDDSIVSDNEEIETFSTAPNDKVLYNPNDKDNVAYFINNESDKYIDTSNFALHNIEVPIYSGNIIYGEEKKTKKYKVKLFAPNMYEMFSAQTNLYGHFSHSYWLINSSSAKNVAAAITDIGVPVNEEYVAYSKFGIRVCAYLKDNIVITSGSGTYGDPYLIG